MRLDHALGLYVQQLRADGRSEHTVRQYQRHVRLLDAWFGGHKLVEDITHEDLARFLNADVARNRPDGRTKKATATNALRSSLRTFFTYASASGITATNPARLIRRARCAAPPPRGLSQEEQRRLLEVLALGRGDAAQRDHALFSLMLAAGLRLGSALGLDVQDVDVQHGELYLRTMKNDQRMVIYFNQRLGSILAGLIANRTDGALFESRHQLRLSSRQVHRRLSHWCRAAGIRATCPHGLRHSFGQTLYARTGDVRLVQQALGHRSLMSTAIYTTVSADRLRKAFC